MADKVQLPDSVRVDLGEAARYLSALSMVVSGVLAVKGDGLGPRGVETVWWLVNKGDERLNDALRTIDAEAGTIEGGRTDG